MRRIWPVVRKCLYQSVSEIVRVQQGPLPLNIFGQLGIGYVVGQHRREPADHCTQERLLRDRTMEWEEQRPPMASVKRSERAWWACASEYCGTEARISCTSADPGHNDPKSANHPRGPSRITPRWCAPRRRRVLNHAAADDEIETRGRKRQGKYVGLRGAVRIAKREEFDVDVHGFTQVNRCDDGPFAEQNFGKAVSRLRIRIPESGCRGAPARDFRNNASIDPLRWG